VSAAGTGSAKRQPTFLAAEISLTGGLPRDAGLRRAQCAFPFAQLAPWHQPPTLRPCGPLTPRLACHTGAGCRSHIAFALQIRRAGSSSSSVPIFSLSSRPTPGHGVAGKGKRTLEPCSEITALKGRGWHRHGGERRPNRRSGLRGGAPKSRLGRAKHRRQ
jgi:hypothetical protein